MAKRALWAGFVAMALGGCTHAHAATDVARSQCAQLAASSIDDGKITSARLVAEQPANAEHPDWPIPNIPEHCRIALTLRPTPDSQIKAEVWLPAVGWNGRFLGVGVGGYAGVINEAELRVAVTRGYAAAATDTGHGTEGTDVWARGHRERIIDYGHRAIHLMTTTAKQLVARFYGKAARYNYFAGCSNGGRQGLMEALRYPDDYDGIVAGAPAADFIGLVVGGFGWNDQVLRKAPFPSRKLPALRRAVLDQCDALDGSHDELIARPEACRFSPTKALCPAQDNDMCLTATEVSALEDIYRGATARDGRSLYPGLSFGGEAPDPPSPGWEGWVVPKPDRPTEPHRLFTGFMRDFLGNGAAWEPANFALERDLAAARSALGSILDANDPNLGAFAQRGGKLILWHGWADQAIPPDATIRYYDALVKTMGDETASGFSRLYLAPGVQHCFLGPGPWAFNWSAAKPSADPRTDMAAALEAWVEKGQAPDALTAIRPKNAYSVLTGYPPLEIERSGLLCPYPQVAKYDGSGSSKDAANYSCVSSR